MNELSIHNPRQFKRNSTEDLILNGLGYCCLWRFFSIYKDTELIAARLGVSERTVRRYKLALANGEMECEGQGNCMKKVI